MLRSLPFAVILLVAASATAQNPPATFQLNVSYSGTTYLADFELHSARGPNFAVKVQQGNGSLATHTSGPVRTYLGTIAGRPGAMASALRRASGSIYYHVLFEDGSEWINNGGSTSLRTDSSWTPNYPSIVTGSGGAGSNVWAAEVGVDLPFSQYSVDNNVDAALEMIEHSTNTVNLIYLRDAGITHRLGRVVVRASVVRDPYLGMTTTGDHLGELRTQWNNVLPSSTHDIGLVATSAVGGGVAYVGVVGNPGYSANGASNEGDFTIVWRHEVGHNWSLGHYDGGTPEGRTINSGNALARMSGSEQAKAIAHRNSRTGHLDNLGPYPNPIPPHASLDRANYVPGHSGVAIDVLDNDHDANGEPFSIVSFDTSTQLGGSVALSPGTGPGGRDELLYTAPMAASNLPDFFTYRIADTAGREGVGNVIAKLTSDTELLAHFPMNEGNGAVANDSSSYQRHAEFDGGPSWQAGRFGSGIYFDGVNDRLLASALDYTTANITITGWVKRNGSQSDWAGIVFCRGGTTTVGFNFGTNNELRYHWDGGRYGWNSGLVVPNGIWTFVALAVTPTGATIYMDPGTGLQSATQTGTHAPEAFDAVLTIGRDPNSSARTFKGTLDDIRIHRRTLTPLEIAAAAAGLGSASDPMPGQFAPHNTSSIGLSWTSSPATTNHRIYLSRNYAEVRDGLAVADRGLRAASSWITPFLGNGSWFWRVDSTDGTTWAKGPVWSFRVIPGTQALAANYGAGCPGSQLLVPQIGTVGPPRLGSSTFAVKLTAAAPNSSAILLVGAFADQAQFGSCRLLVGPPMSAAPAWPTDATGRATLPLPIPYATVLLGQRLFAQFFVVDPGGALYGAGSMSNGLHVTIGL